MRRAFTLFEMMMVVGVIGILVIALLPHLSSVKESAESSICKAHLHALTFLVQNYGMRTGYFPWGSIEPSTHEQRYWTYYHGEGWALYPWENPTLYRVEHWEDYETYCWDFYKRKTDSNFHLGEIFGSLNASSVLACPKIRMGASDNWEGDNHITGYNYNVCFLGYVEGSRADRNYPTEFEHVTHPERVVIFGDGGYSGGVNKFMRAPKTDAYYDASSASLRKAGTQAFRHGEGRQRHCNMAFVDGHVEAFYTPFKSAGKTGWQDETAHTGFISSNNGIYGPRGWGVEDEEESSIH